ncbi:DNA-binding NarL/FixJ family response regulator [Altererythrobacter atlanticus]|uniref:CsgBAC operon transcriptional regulatory protein n=1 Tax=Croceibacterium atlanticum TaxID=1267766 RepID=A0A0F7KVP5_9SPHN|nr:response regulator transcription factor [Croceibacterium atlanticum]AKH42845.1 CsgBAC operon transcriptional regulatory protein [Croceibacterium atlanticum]MBB5731625.1 DNA-binding NarL/FixJ family response regulator [Croceibacterium atlanticum]
MKNVNEALVFQQPTGETLALPNILLLDQSEFRRTCVVASLSSHGFSDIAQLNRAQEISADGKHDLIVIFFDSGEREAAEFEDDLGRIRQLCPKSKIVAIVDEPEEFLGRATGQIHSVLPADMEPELLRASFCLIHYGYGLYPLREDARSPRPFMLSKTSGSLNLGVLEGHPLLAKITPRQRQVLESLLLGQSNKEIAKRLSISESTVKTHVHFIMRILGASNRTQIVLKFAQQGEVQANGAGQTS